MLAPETIAKYLQVFTLFYLNLDSLNFYFRQYDLEVESHGSTPVFEQLIDALSSLTSRLFYQIHRKGDTDDSPPENECLDDLSIKKLPLNSETYGGTKYYYLDVLINSNYEIPFVSEDYVLRMAIATQIDIMAAIIDLGDKELIKKRAKKVGFPIFKHPRSCFDIIHLIRIFRAILKIMMKSHSNK